MRRYNAPDADERKRRPAPYFSSLDLARVSHEKIITDDQLDAFCREMASAPVVAFDTEFVSEDSYRPQLCLVQVAAAGRLAVVNPLSVRDLRPLWHWLAAPGHDTVVHAGREELLFCLAATGRAPHGLFDVQIAAGLVGLEYPAGYGSLLSKILGQRLHKGETRTDWRRRPLSTNQIEYALDDVRYLEAMAAELRGRLGRLGRADWFEGEMADWMADVAGSRTDERWWKVSGSSGLSRRSLAVVREVWRWREQEAQRRDCPTRRVLRDDLIVELAKRRSTDEKQIRAVRGMERGDLQRAIPHLVAAVKRALALPDDQCPTLPAQREAPAQLAVLGQFLVSALASICRAADLAPSIVGTASDVRELIAYRLGMSGGNGRGEPPLLARGWRAQIVGRMIDDLLAGKLAVRIRDPRSDDPLSFEQIAGG